jgi:hypothetical protein
MPFGIIVTIMKNTLPKFSSADELDKLVDAFFKQLEGKKRTTTKPNTAKTVDAKPATLTGLALHLGFHSREQFERYESKGKFAANLKKARLRIEAIYEKKLHQTTFGGAIFALKNLGWAADKAETKHPIPVIKTLKVTIIESGPSPAGDEKEVIL